LHLPEQVGVSNSSGSVVCVVGGVTDTVPALLIRTSAYRSPKPSATQRISHGADVLLVDSSRRLPATGRANRWAADNMLILVRAIPAAIALANRQDGSGSPMTAIRPCPPVGTAARYVGSPLFHVSSDFDGRTIGSTSSTTSHRCQSSQVGLATKQRPVSITPRGVSCVLPSLCAATHSAASDTAFSSRAGRGSNF
jgi:hypothetical protein